MNKKNWLIASAFSIAYALVIGLGLLCLIHLLGGILVAAYFGESFLKEYPRFAPFCLIVGLLALVALILLFCLNLKVSKKVLFTKMTWFILVICSLILSLPIMELWAMFFEYLRDVF